MKTCDHVLFAAFKHLGNLTRYPWYPWYPWPPLEGNRALVSDLEVLATPGDLPHIHHGFLPKGPFFDG